MVVPSQSPYNIQYKYNLVGNAHQAISRKTLDAKRKALALIPVNSRWGAAVRSAKYCLTNGAYYGGTLGAPLTIPMDGLVGSGRWGFRLGYHGVLPLAASPLGVAFVGGGALIGAPVFGVLGGLVGLFGFPCRPKPLTEAGFIGVATSTGLAAGFLIGAALAAFLLFVVMQAVRAIPLTFKLLARGAGVAATLLVLAPIVAVQAARFNPTREALVQVERQAAEQQKKRPEKSKENIRRSWQRVMGVPQRLPEQSAALINDLCRFTMEQLGIYEPEPWNPEWQPAAPAGPTVIVEER